MVVSELSSLSISPVHSQSSYRHILTEPAVEPTAQQAITCLTKYLATPSVGPQVMTITIGPGSKLNMVATSLTREEACRMVSNSHFDELCLREGKRQKIYEACDKARRFAAEHYLGRNPFPPQIKVDTVENRHAERHAHNTRVTCPLTSSSISSVSCESHDVMRSQPGSRRSASFDSSASTAKSPVSDVGSILSNHTLCHRCRFNPCSGNC